MIYDIKIFIIIIIIFVILSVNDINYVYKECIDKNPNIIYYIVFHRLIFVFFYMGWLFNNKFILIVYLMILFGIVLYRRFYTYCYITEHVNDVCKYDKSLKYDFFYMHGDEITFLTRFVSLLFVIFIIMKLYY